jgi:hypothetical protein
MAKADILKFQFKKGYDPNRNIKGAPTKFNTTLKELGYTNRQISDTILNLLALTKNEIEIIAGNENYTMLERMIAKALIKDLNRGTIKNFEALLNRAIGKPSERIEMQNEKIEVVYIQGKTIL